MQPLDSGYFCIVKSMLRDMKNLRPIESVIDPQAAHMVGDGFRVMSYFPNGESFGKRMSPFFLLDYNAEVNFPPTDKPRGVDVHPHRGFETVTIAYKGAIAHHDSAGNSGIIQAGDVQWMTAASGILHKEYHEKNYAAQGGPFQMIQLWVNLPKKYKMTTPKYQNILHADKGKYQVENDGGEVLVIAGNYKGAKGAASTFSPLEMYDVRLKNAARLNFSLPASYNTALLVLDGALTVNGNQTVKESQMLVFENSEGEIELEANADSVFLFLSGEPINEPVASYGPFVMNTVQEIQEALDDFHAGKFGVLN